MRTDWKVGDTAYGIELPDGSWMYLSEPFAVDGVEAQPYTVVDDKEPRPDREPLVAAEVGDRLTQHVWAILEVPQTEIAVPTKRAPHAFAA